MNPLDDLNNDDVAGDEKPVAAPASTSITPRASGDDGATLKAQALAGLPAEWRERLIRDAGEAGVRHDNDVGWLLVGSVVHSATAAFAAGNAAQAVQDGVAAIPDQIFQGAIKAGDEVKGALRVEIRDRAVEAGQALKMLINSAAGKGATDLKTAAADLDIRLGKIPADVQKSLDDYKKNGVAEFAKAAQVAGKTAAETALWAQVSRSALVSVLAFCFAVLVGAGGLWGYLLITHRVMPQGITVMTDPFSHKPVMTLPSGSTAVLPGQIPDLP